jgi:hypothetical protein
MKFRYLVYAGIVAITLAPILPAVTIFGLGLGTVGAVVLTGGLVLSGLHRIYRGVLNTFGIKDGIVEPFLNKINGRIVDSLKHLTRGRDNHYDFNNGCWDVKTLPADMSIVDSDFWHKAVFHLDGLDRSIIAVKESRGQKAVFSFDINGHDFVSKVETLLKGKGLLPALSLTLSHDDIYTLSGTDVNKIREAAKLIFPPLSCKVQRTTTTVNQYVVSGCKTYEEALAKFKSDSDVVVKFNSYIHVVDNVEGNIIDRGFSGNPNVVPSLGFGDFVINETATSVFNGTAKVPADTNDPALAIRRASEEFKVSDGVKADIASSQVPVLSEEKVSSDVTRHMFLDGKIVDYVDSHLSSLESPKQSLIFHFDSEKGLADVLNGDKKLADRMVLLDDDIPSPKENEYVVTVPANGSVIRSLSPTDGSVKELMDTYGPYGLSKEDASATAVLGHLKNDGFITAYHTGEVPLDGAFVNGVPVEDFKDRLVMKDGLKLDSEELRHRWLDEASRISSLNMSIDMKEGVLIVSSCVDGKKMNERFTIAAADAERLGERDVTKAQMKEVFMGMHPEMFLLYKASDGKPLYDYPLHSFVTGDHLSIHGVKEVKASAKKKETKKKTSGVKI